LGLIVQSFDAQIQIYRSSYSECFKRQDYLQATHFAELTHATLPPRARISEFESFKVESRDFNYSDKVNAKAFDYCVRWQPLIETAIAMYRDELLSSDR